MKNNIKKPFNLSWHKAALLYVALNFVVTAIIFLINGKSIFFNFATGIIISWILTLVSYYFWAIYFFNVNLGVTDEEWEDLKELKRINPEAVKDKPVVNPHAGETLGLPPGTVRATLALTLLVGALALMLASFELPYKLEQNNLFIDNYEFIKTAFLMMVAFYFGNKSLDFLRQRNPVYSPAGQQKAGKTAIGDEEMLPSPVKGNMPPLATILKPQKPEESSGEFDDKDATG